MSTIELKTVGDVLAKEYIIPEYQRGYRWGKEQVEDLLNDLCEFHSKNKGPNEFYCLQPIVVKKGDDNKYIVIDGQQRLTTLKMIVCYLEAPKELKEKVVFEEILREVEYKDKERKEGKSKIDNFFKNYAWFNIRKFKYNVEEKNLLDTLKDRVKFIWYEVEGDANGDKIFERLNIGKIPLTNAELLKACFLCDSNFNEGDTLTQIQMASEWDQIELELQNPSLWYFFNNEENRRGTYIDAIFDLIYPNNAVGDPYYTFRKFYDKLNGVDAKKKWKEEWRKVYNLFLQLKEWHDDFKLGGFAWFAIKYCRDEVFKGDDNAENYVAKNPNFKTIIINWIKKTYDNDLKKIQKGVNGSSDSPSEAIKKLIEDITYESKGIKEILYLANICYCANNKMTSDNSSDNSQPIPFPYEKTLNLDIEHISSKMEDIAKSKKEFLESLLPIINMIIYGLEKLKNIPECYLKKLKDVQNKLCDKDDKFKFDDLYQNIKELPFLPQYIDSLEEDEKATIGNLVLLPKSINRSYKNNIFTVKRECIANNVASILPLTLNAFFREFYYRDNANYPENALCWSKKDVDEFEKYMINLIILNLEHRMERVPDEQ